MTCLMFIHDQDDSDNLHAKEAAMLGLHYESLFAKEVQAGDINTPRLIQFDYSYSRFAA